MVSIKAKTNALNLLREYNGSNPYILRLRRDVTLLGKLDLLNDFAVEYINSNYTYNPRQIDKLIKIADWYGEKLQKDWNLDFTPVKLKIYTLLGETTTTYHVSAQYRKSVQAQMMFLPKKAVLTNFTLPDYHNLIVDFERYDRLSDNSVMFQNTGKVHHILPHQKEAVQFLLSRKKCVLADDMGLGKSASLSVAAIEGNFDSIIIVCPASLKTNWKEELMWYAPERDITIIDSFNGKTKAELEKMLGYGIGKSGKKVSDLQQEAKERGKWADNRFVIVNYDILSEFYKIPLTRSKENIEKAFNESPMLQYAAGKKTLLIVDEAHRLSESKSNRYKIIKDFVKRGNPDSIYLATGTPITNDPTNYFTMLDIIGDCITDDWLYYMKRYCGAVEICKDKNERDYWTSNFLHLKGKSTWFALTDDEKVELREYLKKHCKMITIPKEPTNLDELRERTSHLYLRREKEDINNFSIKKNVHEVFYSFTPKQWAEYSRLWNEYEEQHKNENPDVELNKNLLEGAVYRAYCCEQMIPNTVKLANKLLAEGRKVVIICCYDSELYTLRDIFGDNCVVYNGKMNLKEKEISKKEFIENPDKKVFIGNLQACGVGLTLVVANALIFNNFNYTVGDNRQGEDRIFRIGQTKDVDIYYQMFIGTQYEHIWNTVLKKELCINQVIKKESEK